MSTKKVKELEDRIVELVRISDKLYEENVRLKALVDSIGLQRSINQLSKLTKDSK